MIFHRRSARPSAANVRARLASITAATALLATAGLVAAPIASAATIDDTPWVTSFDEVAQPAGLLTSTAYPLSLTNFSGNNFSQGSLNNLVTASSASTENAPNEGVARLLDGDPATKWFAGSSSAWARYELSEARSATRYILTTANDAVDRNPRSWNLEGSSNGNDWTMLDTQTNQLGTIEGAPSFYSRHEYTIPAQSRGDYKFYRLNVSAVNGTVNATQLGDFELIDDASSAMPGVIPWHTYIDNGPTSSRVARLNSGFTGTKALAFKGFNTNDDRAQATNILYQGLDLEVGANSELSYKIFPNLDEFELAYPSTYVAVDLEYTDAGGTDTWRLSTTAGLTDQYGYGVSPLDQGRAKTMYGRQWNSVRIDLSSLAGKRITKVMLSYDNPDGSNISTASGWIDDIRLGSATPVNNADGSLTNFVDTRRGTNSNGDFSRGNNFPATAVPNGFNLYTPFTEGGSNTDLYRYQQSNDGQNRPRLQGLGVSHEPSRWISDRNQFQLMPSITTDATPNGDLVARELPFDRATEIAQPDEYSVQFLNGIKAEIAPTSRAAIFRFNFPAGADKGTIFIDKVQTNANFTVAGNTFSGYTDGNTAGATRMFVYGTFSATPSNSGTANNRDSAKFVQFNNPTAPIEVRFATSLMSVDQAQKNLQRELTGKTFAQVQADAEAAWDERLEVIETTGDSEVDKINFYSNLYRLNLYPNAQHEDTSAIGSTVPTWQYASPVNAATTALTDTTTNAPIKDGKMYVNNGFWDTYRTAWPLYSYLYPDIVAELTDGFVEQYRAGGWIARWSAPGYDNQMTGTSSDASFADAYIQGALPTGLAQEAYAAALKNATALPASNVKSDGNYGSDYVGRKTFSTSPFLGYTPATQDQSVSWGLEGLINDYAIGKMAEKLSTDPAITSAEERAQYAQEASYFLTRAQGYGNLFDERIGDPDDASTPLGFFTARAADGSWVFEPGSYNLDNRTTVYNPEDWDSGNGTPFNNHTYTETNGWNFAFHAPYDVDGLASLYGGKDGLIAKLNTFFATPEKAETRRIHETYEARDVRMGQWGASNQVSFHIPYLYAAAGNPSGTQKIVREAMQRLFVGSEIGQGYPGDEDNGAMASWYIYSALGFYPLAVGSGTYVLGSPIFDSATITPLGTDNSLTIAAAGNSSKNVYIQSATLNGQPLASATVSQDDLTKGTRTLNLTMGDQPSTWGEQALAAAAPEPATDVANPPYAQVSAPGATNVQNLVDNDSTTVTTFGSAAATVTVTPIGGAAVVSEYTITNAATGANPASWTLQGRNSAGTWVTVDQRTSELFHWRTQIRPFKVASPSAYSAYRLNITATSNGAGASIGEVELLATSTSDAADGLTVTPVTDAAAEVGEPFTGVLAGVSGVPAGATITATANYGSGAVPATIEAIPSGGYVVRAGTTFDVAGVHDVTVAVTRGTETKTVIVTVDASFDRRTEVSIARNADVACFSEVGIAANCDGLGGAFDKAKVNQAGVQFGVEQTVQLSGETFRYTLPDVESGTPDTLTGRGQIVTTSFGAGTTKLSVLGTANEGEQGMAIFIGYADGTEQQQIVHFGDWTSNSTSPIPGTSVLFNTSGRLTGTQAELPAQNAAIFATTPVSLQIDGSTGQAKKVKQIRMENQGGSLTTGRTHIVGFATNGAAATPLVVSGAGSAVISTALDATINPTLAHVSGGQGTPTATINWGDGTGLGSVDISGSGDIVGSHAYAAPGTYTVTVTVADDVQSTSITRSVMVIKPAVPPVPGAIAVSAPQFSKKNQAFGSIAARRARVAVVVTGATSGTVTIKAGAKVLGTANVVKSGTAYTATVVVPAKLAIGKYAGVTATLTTGGRTVNSAAATGIFKVVKAKTKRVKVKVPAFARATSPRVTVKVAKLTNGLWATGKLRVVVGKKVVRTVKLRAKKKGKARIKLPAAYSSSIKVRVKFVPKSAKTVKAKQSKRVTAKVRR